MRACNKIVWRICVTRSQQIVSHINVLDLNNLAKAKIQALEERLNEATRCFQLAKKEFQARLQEYDA